MIFKTVKKYLHNSLEIQTFNKYEISKEGVVRHKKTEKETSFYENGNGYLRLGLMSDYGKRHNVYLHVILMSTFGTPKIVTTHTVDHKDRDPKNNHISNLRWLDKSGQSKNQECPETLNTAFIIIKDDIKKTAKEWAVLEGVTERSILRYAQKKQKGFMHTEYKNLEDEEWKQVSDKIWVSNFGRYALHNGYARKVMYAYELGTNNKYPMVSVNYENVALHILIFKAFYTETYNPEMVVCHLDDDPLNANLMNLYLGTRTDNGNDAHDNGKHTRTKTERFSCVGIDKKSGEKTKPFKSQTEAADWLRNNNWPKANFTNISACINGKLKSAYGYYWKKI